MLLSLCFMGFSETEMSGPPAGIFSFFQMCAISAVGEMVPGQRFEAAERGVQGGTQSEQLGPGTLGVPVSSIHAAWRICSNQNPSSGRWH